MTNEPFHTHLDRATAATWDAITTLPFLAELSTGRLEEARFAFFISQDIHYLDAFAGILQRAAELADNAEARALRPPRPPRDNDDIENSASSSGKIACSDAMIPLPTAV